MESNKGFFRGSLILCQTWRSSSGFFRFGSFSSRTFAHAKLSYLTYMFTASKHKYVLMLVHISLLLSTNQWVKSNESPIENQIKSESIPPNQPNQGFIFTSSKMGEIFWFHHNFSPLFGDQLGLWPRLVGQKLGYWRREAPGMSMGGMVLGGW